MPSAVITGAAHAGQVGEAIAQRFARDRWDVILLDRNADEAEARAAALRAAGGRATAHAVDLTDEAALATVAALVRRDASDGIAALVHAAGGFAAPGIIADTDLATLHRMLAVNLVTAYATTRAFVADVRRARGAIVYFASPAALPGGHAAGMTAYAAAKAGVTALMRGVAAEERAAGVRANAVAPGTVRTTTNVQAMGDAPAYVERESVAAVVRWLCDEAARDVTGQVVPVGV